MIPKERFNEILNIYNYYNMVIIVDEKGMVQYFFNNRPDINSVTEQDILGHNVLESCVNITEETSTLFYVMRTGKAIKNTYQELLTSNGDRVYSYCSTMPIKEGDKIIGAVEMGKYIDVKAGDSIAAGDISIDNFHVEKDKLYTIDDIKGSSREIERLKFKIGRVAETDSTVLIYGETGTGKELVAESIHSCGLRRHKKFVAQNCAAIPPMLLESILFGTEKGSFTGAENRKGLLETAQGGTLFLDEINTMDVDTQSKILKAIEEKKIMRVGDYEQRPIDVRVVAATNEDPLLLVRKHLLREDLYYRLRVIQIDLPALAERQSDIPLLTEYFINKYNKLMHRNIAGVDKDMMDFLLRREWKGNIRELENTIECAFNFAEGAYLTLDDLPWLEQETEAGEGYEHFDVNDDRTLKELLQEYECEAIREALTAAGSDVRKAADMLGLTRQNLHHKLKQYRLE